MTQIVRCGLLFSLLVTQNVFMTLASKSRQITPPITTRFLFGISLLILCLMGLNCGNDSPGANKAVSIPRYGFEVVNTWPHDTSAFTQGLVFHNGQFLESTGQEGHSSLRRVEPETGNILKRISVPTPFFAEGIALLNGKIYQLTWQDQVGFVYDANTLDKIAEFKYYGEGWGLTTDGSSLILSDGSNRIRFLNPDNFQVTKTITVLDGSRAVEDLNELEYVQGEIFANVWHSDAIARINPETGKVQGWIDLRGLLAAHEITDPEAVLNGIAYDESSKRLFVTGKLWPKLFEIRIK